MASGRSDRCVDGYVDLPAVRAAEIMHQYICARGDRDRLIPRHRRTAQTAIQWAHFIHAHPRASDFNFGTRTSKEGKRPPGRPPGSAETPLVILLPRCPNFRHRPTVTTEIK